MGSITAIDGGSGAGRVGGSGSLFDALAEAQRVLALAEAELAKAEAELGAWRPKYDKDGRIINQAARQRLQGAVAAARGKVAAAKRRVESAEQAIKQQEQRDQEAARRAQYQQAAQLQGNYRPGQANSMMLPTAGEGASESPYFVQTLPGDVLEQPDFVSDELWRQLERLPSDRRIEIVRNLANLAAARGAAFHWNTTIEAIDAAGDAVTGVRVRDAGGASRTLVADAYVVALGSFSPLLLAPIGVPCGVYPAKGYSITLDVGAHRGAPVVSLTDLAWKIVLTRLGDRLRVAGTAELNGWNTEMNDRRCRALVERTFELFPDAGERESATFWTGLRPATPSNVPLIGRTRRYRNLWLDTGHGTLGWTMACGSGRALADLIAGRAAGVDFAFLGGSRSG